MSGGLSTQAGALLVGTMLSSMLMGAATALLSTYLRTFPKDRRVFTLLALTSWGLGLSLTCINMSYLWEQSIGNFGSVAYLELVNWRLAASFPFIGISCGILQTFLGWRVWVLSGRSWRWAAPVGVALTLALAASVLSIYVGVWYGSTEQIGSLLTRKRLVWIWWALEMLSELSVSGCLIFFVVFKPSRYMQGVSPLPWWRRLLLRGVECNVPSIVIQVIVLVLFAETDSSGFWFAAAGFSVPPFASISCCLALLSRAHEDAVFAYETHVHGMVTKAPSRAVNRAQLGNIDIAIQNEIAIDEGDPRSPHPFNNRRMERQPVTVNFGPDEHEMGTLEKRRGDFEFA